MPFLEGSQRQLKAIPIIILAILLWEGFCWIYETAKPTDVNHIVIINDSDQPIDAKIVDDQGKICWDQKANVTSLNIAEVTVFNYPFPFNHDTLIIKAGNQLHKSMLIAPGRYYKTLVIKIDKDNQVQQKFVFLPRKEDQLP